MTVATRRRNHSLRGVLVCVAMFLLGGAVLWGLFQAPTARSPASPQVPWGPATGPLRFVSIDFAGQGGVGTALTSQVVKLDPDYVLVQNIRFDDVLPLAQALAMERSYHPALFQRSDPRSKDAPGDLLLSKHALFDARRVDLDRDPQDAYMHGIAAVAVVNGVRFEIVSGVGGTDASLRALDLSRSRSESRPIVLATGFVHPQKGGGQYRGDLNAIVPVSQETEHGGPVVPVAALFADAGWAATRAGAPPRADGKGLLLHAELTSAGAATRPGR